MSSTNQTNLPSLQLQLRQIIDHMELLVEKPGAIHSWGIEVGAALEDEAERLADLSARIAFAHRPKPVDLSLVAKSVG